MTALEALAILHLQPECTALEVRTAYRVRAADLARGILQGVTAEQLRTARDTLTNSLEAKELPCQSCHGSGSVQHGFSLQRCVVCGGTGERK
jgi:RecJ-like exonuclease